MGEVVNSFRELENQSGRGLNARLAEINTDLGRAAKGEDLQSVRTWAARTLASST